MRVQDAGGDVIGRLRAHARGKTAPCGFAFMLAGECPLFSAWGRFEDGAPAPHEHLRRGWLATRPHRE